MIQDICIWISVEVHMYKYIYICTNFFVVTIRVPVLEKC